MKSAYNPEFRSDARPPQNRENNRGNRVVAVGRSSHGQNTEENTENVIRESSKRSDGLSREQRHFILEKLVGQDDLQAALAAGYSLSTARNTKQKIWARPGVRAEFERLKAIIFQVFYSAAREQLVAETANPQVSST